MLEKIKKAKRSYIIVGTVLSVIGLCFLFLSSSATALTITVGIIVALFGAALGTVSITKKKTDFAFIVRIVFAVIYFAGGVLISIFSQSAFSVLCSVLCLMLIVDASLKLNMSLTAQRHYVRGWWAMMALSAVVIITAFIVGAYTPAKTNVTAILLGITALLAAGANFYAIFLTAKCKAAEKAEIYYEVYKDIENANTY